MTNIQSKPCLRLWSPLIAYYSFFNSQIMHRYFTKPFSRIKKLIHINILYVWDRLKCCKLSFSLWSNNCISYSIFGPIVLALNSYSIFAPIIFAINNSIILAINNWPPWAAALATSSPRLNCDMRGPSWPDCNAALNEERACNNTKSCNYSLKYPKYVNILSWQSSYQ